jgi:NADPH:quinone reductase-like Zn-dependent oxidoreductase
MAVVIKQRARRMRAMIPAGAGSVALDAVDEPSPGEHEALVAVEAFSVNRGEAFLLDAPRTGWRPGKDIAGTVVRPAASGAGPARGQRVVGHPEYGGWAERVAVPVDRLAVVPVEISAPVAAALPLAGLTALRLSRTVGSLAGKRVLLTGASGGVGHYFVELASAQGAYVTAVVGDHARGKRLRQLGASDVVTAIDHAGCSYDVVIESVGGSVFPAAWRRLRHDGLFVWMGQVSRRAPVLDFFDWTGGSSATLRKFLYSDDPVRIADDLATLVRLVQLDRLHPEIDSVRPWSETAAVLTALSSRQIRGKAILGVTT